MLDHPRVRNSDPMTSWAAAGSAKDLAKAHAAKIVQCLIEHGSLGKDGIAHHTGLESMQVARRLHELEREGEIFLTGNVVKSKSNRMEREWKIAPIQRTLL
jgi:transcription initiation factor IIE alpha subunit